MRTPKQVKTIASQLEVLEELRDQLENTVDYINSVITKGKEWIDETNNESFVKINQFLVNETSECLRRCSSISDEKDVEQTTVENVHRNTSSNEEATETDNKNCKKTVLKTQEQETMSTTQSQDIKIVLKNLKERFKQKERMSKKLHAKTEQSFHLKFIEVMRELEAASNFMSNLQSQMESLSSQVKEMSKFDNASDLIDRLHSMDVTVTEQHKKMEELQQKSTEINELLLERGELTHQTKRENSAFEKLHEDLKCIKDSQDQLQISLQKHDEIISGPEKNFEDSETLKSKQLQDLETEMQSKYVLLNDLKSQSESTTADNKQIKTDLERLCHNFDKLKLAHQTLRENSAFEKWHEDLKCIQDSQDKLQISLQKHDENIRGLEKNFEDSETLKSKQLQDLKTEMQSKYLLLSSVRFQSNCTAADNKQIKTDLERLCHDFDKLKQESTDLSTQISTLSVTSASNRKDQIEKISSIETKNNDVSSRVDQLWSRNVAYEERNSQKFKEDLSEIKKTQSNKFTFINQKFESLEIAITTLKDMDKTHDLKFEEIKKELTSSSGSMIHLQSQNESLCASINKKTVEIDEVRQTLNEIIQHNVTNLNSAIARNYHELNKRLSDNTKAIEALQSQINYQSMTMNAMDNNYKSITKEVNSIKRRVEEPVGAAAVRRFPMEKHSYDQAEQFNSSHFQQAGAVDTDDESDDDEQEGFDEHVSFDAHVYVSATVDLLANETLSCFTCVTDDLQDDFNPETGIFTVPYDGLYLCGLFIEIVTFLHCDLTFNIIIRGSNNSETIIGRCHCRHRNITVSAVVIKQLRENDELFVRPGDNYGNIEFNSYSHFMCASINRQ